MPGNSRTTAEVIQRTEVFSAASGARSLSRWGSPRARPQPRAAALADARQRVNEWVRGGGDGLDHAEAVALDLVGGVGGLMGRLMDGRLDGLGGLDVGLAPRADPLASASRESHHGDMRFDQDRE